MICILTRCLFCMSQQWLWISRLAEPHVSTTCSNLSLWTRRPSLVFCVPTLELKSRLTTRGIIQQDNAFGTKQYVFWRDYTAERPPVSQRLLMHLFHAPIITIKSVTPSFMHVSPGPPNPCPNYLYSMPPRPISSPLRLRSTCNRRIPFLSLLCRWTLFYILLHSQM